MEHRLKIFFFGSDYPPTNGGISTYTYNLLSTLSNEDSISARARIFGNKNPRKEILDSKLEIDLVRSVNFFYIGWRIFLDVLAQRSYETLYALNLFPIGFWVVLWSKIFNKKSVITFYGADACDTRTSAKVVLLQKWALTHADKAITISGFTRQTVVARYGLSRSVDVLYPILPVLHHEKMSRNEIREKLGLVPGDFVILSVCRLVKRKGVEYLIDALALTQDTDIKAVIVGDGPERTALEEHARNAGLSNRIQFAGKVPDLTPYYSLADCAVLLSYMIEERGDFEGLGLVLLEAQSYGLPVIGTRSGGIPEAFENTVTGIVVPERDPRAVLQAIEHIKNNKGAYQSPESFLQNRFGREVFVGKLMQILC